MAAGLAAGGLVLGAAGLYQSYKGQRDAGKAAQAAANYEASIHEMEAKFIEYEKEMALKMHKRKKSAIVGTQAATAAGQGFKVTSGSNKNILWDTINLLDFEAQLIRWQGNVNVWREEQIAKQLRATGATAGTLGSIRATGTLLGGAASLLTGGANAWSYFRPALNYSTTGYGNINRPGTSGGLPLRT